MGNLDSEFQRVRYQCQDMRSVDMLWLRLGSFITRISYLYEDEYACYAYIIPIIE